MSESQSVSDNYINYLVMLVITDFKDILYLRILFQRTANKKKISYLLTKIIKD